MYVSFQIDVSDKFLLKGLIETVISNKISLKS